MNNAHLGDYIDMIFPFFNDHEEKILIMCWQLLFNSWTVGLTLLVALRKRKRDLFIVVAGHGCYHPNSIPNYNSTTLVYFYRSVTGSMGSKEKQKKTKNKSNKLKNQTVLNPRRSVTYILRFKYSLLSPDHSYFYSHFWLYQGFQPLVLLAGCSSFHSGPKVLPTSKSNWSWYVYHLVKLCIIIYRVCCYLGLLGSWEKFPWWWF